MQEDQQVPTDNRRTPQSPVYVSRLSTGSSTVEAAVWETQAAGGAPAPPTYRVTVCRRSTQNGRTRRSRVFRPQDVPALALALQDCALFIGAQTPK